MSKIWTPLYLEKGAPTWDVRHERCVHDLGTNDAFPPPPWLVEIQAWFKHDGDG